MNTQQLRCKNHIFKNRRHQTINLNIKPKLWKNLYKSGLFIVKKIRFELIYFRILKKIFKRKKVKRRGRFGKNRVWFFIKPNFILSMKSKNSRMGAGVGLFVRLVCILTPCKALLFTHRKSRAFLNQAVKFLFFKLGFKLFPVIGRMFIQGVY